jgi:uncharacterized protein (TIGR03118 family)
MKTLNRGILPLAVLGLFALSVRPENLHAASPNTFAEEDYVSDIPGRADHLDPNLVNPWGIALSPTSPFWVADNGTGVSTLYNGEGEPVPLASPLVVTVPTPLGGIPPSAPTGIVFNGSAGFEVAPGQPARFIFATEDGTISGWNPAAGPTTAILKVDNSAAEAIYKGLAIGINGSGNFLYGADFHGGAIDVFDSDFAPASLAGSFTDPSIPASFAPFNIQNIGGQLYVTYAQADPSGEDVPGPGAGVVSVFDLDGNFIRRLASGGALNAPWGLALAPADFGPFGGDLLVGNFGDGRINAYDLSTGDLVDSLKDANGDPIEIEGLWALIFGNGALGGDKDDLYFTAGIEDEAHGLFGEISHVPEGGGTGPLLGVIMIALFAWRHRRELHSLLHQR